MMVLLKRLRLRWCVVATLLIAAGVSDSSGAASPPSSDTSAALQTSTPMRRAPSPISADDFNLYMHWRDGKDDPRLSNLSDASKMQKIAQASGVDVRRLQHAIAAGEKAAPTLSHDVEEAIRTALKTTPVGADVLSIEVNTHNPHVVAGVKWRCGPEENREKEVSYVAWGVAEGSPLVKTIALWCVSASDQKLFSAKIGRSAFERISVEHIPRFAAARYIRLFEDVRRGVHDE